MAAALTAAAVGRLGADVNEVVVYLVSTGTLAGITVAVRKFRKRAPWAKVKIEGEPDDGGFLDE